MCFSICFVIFSLNTMAVTADSKPDGDFRFASHYQNHMVLQREPLRSVVWGFGSEGGKVLLSISSNTTEDEKYTTVVKKGPNGEFIWRIELKTQTAGGPFEMVAKSKVNLKSVSVSITDVYFGDVWLCGGQSNMQFPVGQSFRAKEEEALADQHHQIRLFTVQRFGAKTVVYDFPKKGILRPWAIPTKDNIRSFSSICWMYGRKLFDKLKVPIGLISSNYGGTTVEAWSSPDALSECGISGNTPKELDSNLGYSGHLNLSNSFLWNEMIHPLLNTTIKGVIWYQGEANDYQPNLYKCMFPAMIADWRKKWHTASQQTEKLFPFGFVQLCNNAKNMSYIGPYPTLRWSQTAGVGYVPNKYLPNTFMAVTIDLPDIESPYTPIHPRDKTDVAQRLYLGAMATVYGRKVQWTGPIYESVVMTKVMPGFYGIAVTYKRETILRRGIEVRSKDGFEVLLTSKSSNEKSFWKPVQIITNGFDYVILSVYIQKGWTINSIRYEWRNYPCHFKQCAVYNTDAKLPSPPFNATVSSIQTVQNIDLKNMVRINNYKL